MRILFTISVGRYQSNSALGMILVLRFAKQKQWNFEEYGGSGNEGVSRSKERFSEVSADDFPAPPVVPNRPDATVFPTQSRVVASISRLKEQLAATELVYGGAAGYVLLFEAFLEDDN
jgi:hypothetical protein